MASTYFIPHVHADRGRLAWLLQTFPGKREKNIRVPPLRQQEPQGTWPSTMEALMAQKAGPSPGP